MDKLNEWMALTKISSAQLGRDIGATENSINNWLAGRNYPHAIFIRKLHERTSIPLEDLVPQVEKA